MALFSLDSMVQGFHAYQSVWEPSYGEILMCRREPNKRMDPFAVAVVKNGTIVGHVPRMISASCSLFFRKRGSAIHCKITGTRRYYHRVV